MCSAHSARGRYVEGRFAVVLLFGSDVCASAANDAQSSLRAVNALVFKIIIRFYHHAGIFSSVDNDIHFIFNQSTAQSRNQDTNRSFPCAVASAVHIEYIEPENEGNITLLCQWCPPGTFANKGSKLHVLRCAV